MSLVSPSANGRVLLVDDEELYLRLLAEDLERRGHTVTVHRDWAAGEAAYREIQRSVGAPALVVDLIQPGENGGYLGGLDLLRRLQPLAAQRQDVIALMDSRAAWLDTAARSLGAMQTVRKPDLQRTQPEHLDQALRAFVAETVGAAPPRDNDAASGAETEGNGAWPLAGPASGAGGQETEAILGALEELRHAPDPGSVLLLLLRLVSEQASWGILYEVEGDHLRGSGGFGLGDENGPRAREETLALDCDTLVARAFWSGRLQVARGQEAAWPRGEGESPAADQIALPVMGKMGVVGVIHAAMSINGDTARPLKALSVLAGTASLVLERL